MLSFIPDSACFLWYVQTAKKLSSCQSSSWAKHLQWANIYFLLAWGFGTTVFLSFRLCSLKTHKFQLKFFSRLPKSPHCLQSPIYPLALCDCSSVAGWAVASELSNSAGKLSGTLLDIVYKPTSKTSCMELESGGGPIFKRGHLGYRGSPQQQILYILILTEKTETQTAQHPLQRGLIG